MHVVKIRKAIKQQATSVVNAANNVAQTEIGLLAGSGNTPQRQLETSRIAADKVLERLSLSRSPDSAAFDVPELLKDVDAQVIPGQVKAKLTTGKFVKVYNGRGLAKTFDFDNEDIPISFGLEEVEGTPFSSEQEANSSDESSIFVEIIKNNLIIEAEGFYNT